MVQCTNLLIINPSDFLLAAMLINLQQYTILPFYKRNLDTHEISIFELNQLSDCSKALQLTRVEMSFKS